MATRRDARLDQRDSICREDWSKLWATSEFKAGSGGDLRHGSVVDGQVFVAVQPGRVQDAIEPVRALIDGQAGSLTKAMRARPHGVGRHAESDGVAALQIHQVETYLDGDVDMDIGVEIMGAEGQRTRIAVPQVTDDCLQERDLEGLADVLHAETLRRLPAGIGEPAGCEAEPQRIRKAIEEDMVPDAADGRVRRRRQRAGRQRMRKAGPIRQRRRWR